jgi:uncharacterized protein
MSTGPESPPPPYDGNEPERQEGPPPHAYGPADPQAPGGPPGYGPQGYGPPPVPGQAPAPPPGGFVPGPRPLRPDEERLWAIGAHLGPLVLGFVAPLVVWLVFKERSAFLDRTGKEALNMQLSYLIYFFVAGLSILLLVGLVLLPVVGIAWLVLMIVASVKVASYEDYRYPAIIRFVS